MTFCLDTTIIKPEKDVKIENAVILLHGYGGDGKDTSQKSLTFFEDLKIKNLEIYFDPPNTLAKKFKLRGLPTTIFFNKEGLEFARIIGSIDFVDEKFIKLSLIHI